MIGYDSGSFSKPLLHFGWGWRNQFLDAPDRLWPYTNNPLGRIWAKHWRFPSTRFGRWTDRHVPWHLGATLRTAKSNKLPTSLHGFSGWHWEILWSQVETGRFAALPWSAHNHSVDIFIRSIRRWKTGPPYSFELPGPGESMRTSGLWTSASTSSTWELSGPRRSVQMTGRVVPQNCPKSNALQSLIRWI